MRPLNVFIAAGAVVIGSASFTAGRTLEPFSYTEDRIGYLSEARTCLTYQLYDKLNHEDRTSTISGIDVYRTEFNDHTNKLMLVYLTDDHDHDYLQQKYLAWFNRNFCNEILGTSTGGDSTVFTISK